MKDREMKDNPSRNAILDFIVQYKKENDGCAPSYDEIALATAVSKSTVSHHIKMLERHGVLKTGGYKMIAVTGGEWVHG